jgi:hypothetical protein
MTRRDKVGLLILIVLFIVLGSILFWTVTPFGPGYRPQDSIFVQQRIINLQKSE